MIVSARRSDGNSCCCCIEQGRFQISGGRFPMF
nr:MAG TPA: hypothetical protein [Caudoviricetes sp.]